MWKLFKSTSYHLACTVTIVKINKGNFFFFFWNLVFICHLIAWIDLKWMMKYVIVYEYICICSIFMCVIKIDQLIQWVCYRYKFFDGNSNNYSNYIKTTHRYLHSVFYRFCSFWCMMYTSTTSELCTVHK